MFRHTVLALSCACILSSPTLAQFSRKNPITQAVARTSASIVTIKAYSRYSSKPSIGTGVIIDERGYIVTNRHVVGSLKQVQVVLKDESELAGNVIMAEPTSDLAVVKIDVEKKLSFLTLAPVSDLMVGETVIAVGHPFGYANTVSVGIISALGRKIPMPNGETLTHLIQHDASINQGNSGGPLLNINGELIGINVAIRDGAQGIAFAINAGTVRDVLSQRLSALRIAGVTHGLATAERVTAETGDRQHVVVAAVYQHGAAATAGLQQGDEIVTVAGRQVANRFDVERSLWDARPGQNVAIRLVRNGQEMTVNLTLSQGQGTSQAAAQTIPGNQLTSSNPVNFRD